MLNKRGENMIELQGKYNTAKIFTDVVDEASIAQVIELCNQEFAAGSRIRMMPDIHAGAGCTVGTTMTVSDRIVPNLVGVDIGCGMYTLKLKEKNIELQKLDKVIREKIPSGFGVRSKPHALAGEAELSSLRCIKAVNPARAELSIGSLGGGNHFIEVDKDESGALYLVIHSGSRHLGVEVAGYYQKRGYDRLNRCDEAAMRRLAEELKAAGKQKQIEAELTKWKSTKRTAVPKHLAYVEGEDFENYLHDMEIVQAFAELNRRAIAAQIVKSLKLHVVDDFTTVHNYIDVKSRILRKGSVSAQKGERLLIPINMRDGSLLCIGKGNEDWNCSAPHGAGRLMSRAQAKQSFTVSEFKKQMAGIYTTSVGADTLDECPMTYKSMEDIAGNISPTVEIISVMKPIYNFKAGAE